MKRLFFSFILLLCVQLISASSQSEEPQTNTIHHDLKIRIEPKDHYFVAEDTVTVPENLLPEIRFLLHKGLGPSTPTKGVKILKEAMDRADAIVEAYKIELPPGLKTFTLKYGGTIDHPIEQYGKEQARGISQTKGMISDDGVYLAGSSFWYPIFDNEFLTFNLTVELPPGWDAVSQGERKDHRTEKASTHVRWESPEPQEEIFLVAAKFHESTRSEGKNLAMVFLRTPDRKLAEKYLSATIRYISMYEKLIGPYPYKKFALVENFWETGFGMPSFTLLGSKVIRFPFIIDSSYPHEILHNWWGNSVFPDYEKGNWSEGLTAYLADHLLKEQKGEGVEYRQTTLQKYADYVIGGRDFPLTEFRSRHSSSSEAIGYGKSLMFFHMLRQELGDSVFKEGLRDFYRKNKFKFAAFDDIRQSFERVSGKDLKVQFDQWTANAGAPELRIRAVKTAMKGDKYVLSAVIEQTQSGPAYYLRVPVAVTVEGLEQAYQTSVVMDKKGMEIKLDLPSRPLRVDVDPEFDVFRRLDRNELPPAISQALGAKKLLVILPSKADGPLLKAYRDFARVLSNSGPDEVETRLDTEVARIPSGQAVLILGWENKFFSAMASALSIYDVDINRTDFRIGKTKLFSENHSLVLTARDPEDRGRAMMFIASDLPASLTGLGRKLPHYNKYSFLIFEGAEPVNVAKGRWPVLDSPMTVFIPEEDGRVSKGRMGSLEQRKPLVSPQTMFTADRMMETITFLSSDELEGRGLASAEIDMAAEYIARRFREAGFKPAGDEEGSYFQAWEERENDNPERKMHMKNVVGVIPGKKGEWSKQSVVIGAHYDHLGVVKGQIYPGADDNASGVSVLLELAEALGKSLDPDRNVVFVAFTGEESGKKGSMYYIKNQRRYPVEQSLGMLNLDTVGRLGKRKLLVLGAGSSKEWVHIFRGAGHVAGVEIDTVSEELDSSDQKSFQEAGVPAIQIFTGPHLDYHRPSDTVDKIDPEGLVKVASVAKEVIEYLAAREEPLTATISSGSAPAPGPKKERKVSLGIIPDFAFSGDGCRVSGLVQGSPAEKAGLREGDIITSINSTAIHKLKDLSEVLKSLNPGDKVSITFLRAGEKITVEAEVAER